MRTSDGSLVRALGVTALSATIFNVMIGGGIFGLPAFVAGGLGAAAPLGYIVCAAAMGLVFLCFADAGSRVSVTGGPYAYVEVAFGPSTGFVAGVLLWLVCSLATAAVASLFAAQLEQLWAPLGSAAARTLILLALFTSLSAINVRGVRAGTRLIEGVTVVKLVPLLLLVVVGAFFVKAPNLAWNGVPSVGQVGRTAALLIFAFAGLESALVPSGEVKDPARTVPRALGIAMVAITALYIAIQLVAQGVLGSQLAGTKEAPLAAVGGAIAGAAGRMVIAAGAAISMFGHTSGMTLAAPRILFAFGRDGLLPGAVARVHPRYHTPYIAIVAQSAIVCVVALTSSFVRLADLANTAVLVLYVLCCAASWRLRQRGVTAGGTPFQIPAGPLVPVLAVLVLGWLLSNEPVQAVLAVLIVAAVAALGYLVLGRRPPLPLTEP